MKPTKTNLMSAIILLTTINAENHQLNLKQGTTNLLQGLKMYPDLNLLKPTNNFQR